MGAQEKVRDLVTAMDGAGVAEERREEEREGGKMTASAAAAVSSIPRSPISIDISLPLPQMKPHVESVPHLSLRLFDDVNSECVDFDLFVIVVWILFQSMILFLIMMLIL